MFSFLNLRVGWYLARRQIHRASRWTTVLIVFVMMLTFLNLVVVTGILVGIVEGITDLFRAQRTGDVVIRNLDAKNYIENSPQVLSFLKTLPQVANMSPRYQSSGTIEANYKTQTDQTAKPNETGATIIGVDPTVENSFSHLSGLIKEGTYLSPTGYDEVLLGQQFIDRYSFGEMPGLTALRNVYPGTTIRLTVNGHVREVVVKGIIGTTANSPLAASVYMSGAELAQLMGRTDYNLNEIAIRLKPGIDPKAFTALLKNSGISDVAKVQTFEEAIPNGVAEVKNTFEMLGNAFSSVGLVASSITIFIVIFINAITRRKFIGILKGIGISGEAIEIAYMFQSFIYAVVGSLIGLVLLYGFLVPYISAHPIVLPISNAIIDAPLQGTLVRVVILVVATVIAGYIPARIVVKQNTLDAILGR